MTDRDRDQRNTIRPPAGVQAQIAPPLPKKSRAATPVEGVGFEREVTNVTPVPRPGETSFQRIERHGAENKNELARLREQQDEMFQIMRDERRAELDARIVELEHKAKRREAWLSFGIRAGAVLIAAGLAALGLIKISGCG